MVAVGLLGTVGLGYYDFSALPNQINQITGKIQATNNAPTELNVNVARHRLKSNDCDGHPCTDQERRSDEVVIWLDKQIKAEIADRTGYLENRKAILPLGMLGFLGLSALGVFFAGKNDEVFPDFRY